MANIVYIAASLDGYIARKDGSVDWLNEVPNPDNDDFGFEEFLHRIDAIVMGRKTFEMVVSFGSWPYEKPVFVLSHTLNSVPEGYEDKAEIIQGDLQGILASLHEKGYQNLYIDGGKTIHGFLEQDLIDEIILTTFPVLLGSGVPLFTEMNEELKLGHLRTEVFNNYLVQSHYKRMR